MKIDKEQTLKITLEGSEEIKTFKKFIEKASDTKNQMGFKGAGLNKDEKELVVKLKDKVDG